MENCSKREWLFLPGPREQVRRSQTYHNSPQSSVPNLSLNRTIYGPHTPRPLRRNEWVDRSLRPASCSGHWIGRALMAEYIGPSNAEPGDDRRIIGVTTSASGPRGFGRLPNRG